MENKGRMLTRRRVFVLTLCTLPFALGMSAQAQQPKKLARIGYLSPLDTAREAAPAGIILSALRELGYVGWADKVIK
jgi:hypothetical protein